MNLSPLSQTTKELLRLAWLGSFPIYCNSILYKGEENLVPYFYIL